MLCNELLLTDSLLFKLMEERLVSELFLWRVETLVSELVVVELSLVDSLAFESLCWGVEWPLGGTLVSLLGVADSLASESMCLGVN